MSTTSAEELREEVRRRYAESALAVNLGSSCCDSSCCGGENAGAFGEALYDADQRGELPDAAALASLGCGNPVAVADLHEGETVLDLGSGGGIDVILSARRVGPTGTAYGLDMTDEMLALAQRNARDAGVRNVHFLKGVIEQVPLPAESVDVVISNCVVNLSTDKPAVLAEIARVLRPAGRLALMVDHRNAITVWIDYVLHRGVLRGGLLRESPDELANRWSDGVIARHYTRRSFTRALSPWFDDVEMQVMGQIGEAIPLPRQVRRRVAPFVPIGVQRALLRRCGWFLYATGRRRA